MKIVRSLTRWLLSVLFATIIAWTAGFAALELVIKRIEPMPVFSSYPLLIGMIFIASVAYNWSMGKLKNWAYRNNLRHRTPE